MRCTCRQQQPLQSWLSKPQFVNLDFRKLKHLDFGFTDTNDAMVLEKKVAPLAASYSAALRLMASSSDCT